jgi:hypothetical protein
VNEDNFSVDMFVADTPIFLTAWHSFLLGRVTIPHLGSCFPCMELPASIVYSLNHGTNLYHEAEESSSHLPTLFLENLFWYRPPIYT